jgi:hypothetical protein
MNNAMVLRRQFLMEAGGFSSELHSLCDGFVAMVMALQRGACFIPKPLACWRLMATGFSQKNQADLKLSLDIRDTAANLMRTKYRDLFPLDFVDTWARARSYDVGIVARRQIRRAQEKMLTETFARLWPSRTWQAQLFLGTMRFVACVEAVVMKLLLFGTLIDFPDWVNKRLRSIGTRRSAR